VIALVVCASIACSVGVVYLLARSGRLNQGGSVPHRHLPTELQRQELDRLAFGHRVRTRAVIDRAMHDINRAARQHRDGQ
jgi:hypothetical protein